MRTLRFSAGLLTLALVASGTAGACSSSGSDSKGKGSGSGKDGGDADSGPLFHLDSGTGDLAISPASSELTVDPTAGPPTTIQFTVTGGGGETVYWNTTNTAIGTVDENGLFTPTGEAGGLVEIRATVGGVVVKAQVVVTINRQDNGGDTSGGTDPGFGGLGGVGGEGFGGAISDELVAVLKGTPDEDASLSILYPYDGTVFPLGVLPPLLQWTDGANGNFDGVYVHLSAPPHYDYKGFFARPPGLAADANFVRHPIPKDVWAGATRTAAGSELQVELVLSAGGKAYGPIRQAYRIALAPITGKVYYQAYNTALAHNYDANTKSGEPMGGATLSVTLGQEFPELVAGRDSDDHSGCRVCHTVSAYGDRMVVQHGDNYAASSSIDLKNGNTETTPYADNLMGWIGLYPDGTLGLKNSIDVGGPQQVSNEVGLYDMTDGTAVPTTGLTDFVTSMGLPAFSPDGKHAVFTLFAGPSTPDVGAPTGRQLVVMDFDVNARAFSNPRKLWEAEADGQRPAWSTFLPSSDAVVFQRRWTNGSGETFATRGGAQGELWWVDLATGTPTQLGLTNGVGADGKGYLPHGGSGHDTDELLNYEPSISPVASGGYAWMVFMSRRRYGNVATADPYHSDPRDYDLTKDVTTKKIWMAAIDLNPEPGKDPSHPAFYIPGQELKGVNSRPFFALEPCISDRGTCSTGIDCCTGFCRDGYCAPPPENDCSRIDEKCEVDGDCCSDGRARCVGGFCAVFLQ